jgi:type II secretory pathway component GspD/PulD (secretin)
MTRTALAAIAAVAALMIASVLVPVQVQASPEHERIQLQRPWKKVVPLVDYNRDDVSDALRELIGNVGLSYTLDPDVKGSVTLSLHNVTFEDALGNVLRQVNASYRMEKGIIHIYRLGGRTAVVEPPPVSGPELLAESSGSAGGTVVVQDASFLYVLRETKMFKLRKTDLRVVAAGAVPR